MPRCRTSIKKQRVDKKRHLRNLKVKQQLKKTIKEFQELLTQKKINEAKAFLCKVYSLLDKAAKKQIIHPNTANRKKSRLTQRIQAIK
jgi:small subunit ribosomal protein S20